MHTLEHSLYPPENYPTQTQILYVHSNNLFQDTSPSTPGVLLVVFWLESIDS